MTMEVRDDSDPLRLMIFGGHPADVFDNAGGTLAKHIRRGDLVTAVGITHGVRVHDVMVSEALHQSDQVPPEDEVRRLMAERSEVKRQEVIDACAVYGIDDVRFLTVDDSVLLVKEELIVQVARLIRELRPDIVITHNPFENGAISDQHAITSQVVMHGIQYAGGVDPADRNPPHRVAQIFFMGVPTSCLRTDSLTCEYGTFCNVFVDVSDVIHLKIEALDKMKSQQYDGLYARKITEAINGNFGMGVGVAYAEAFMSYRSEVHDALPLTPFLRQRAREPESDWYKRTGFLVTRDGKLPTP